MSDSFEKERIEEMAMSFGEQLSIVYPEGPPFDDEKESGESSEASLFQNYLQNVIDELPYSSDFGEFKKSLTLCLERKTKNSQKDNNATSEEVDQKPPKKQAFSLFDQLQGGFALPISFEEIQEASSIQERLEVLKKISYLEDLLMDWNKIRPILTDDLSASVVANPNLALQLINLHRKWFDQGRSSSEYTPLLYGICENLLQMLAKIFSLEESQMIQDTNETIQSTMVASLVQNWRDMWLDLMQRGEYSEDLAEEMEKRMFDLFLQPGCCTMALTAQKVLAFVDPSAKWFHSWANHVQTTDHLISVLRGSQSDKKVLPELWTRIQTFRDTEGRNIDEVPITLYSISILSIALCRTRLSHFPWDAFSENSILPEDPDVSKRSEDSLKKFRAVIDDMLEVFLCAVAFISLENNKNIAYSNADLKISVLYGIEAILSGSHNDTDSDLDRRYGKVKSTLQEQDIARDEDVHHFLKTHLKQ